MFDVLDFIDKKRLGKNHEGGTVRDFVESYQSGRIADAQVSAWLMAVCFNGLNDENLLEFTQALSESGQIVSFPFDAVDKHSTGGVGDKLTLLIVPIVAACGVKVAKLSGRGLGFTGGTVDKLEAIPGFKVSLSAERFVEQVKEIGCAISGHSANLAPAEAKFYALRDTTSTLASVPLIASSIVSKKIAGGAKAILFDVKCGGGAFMQTLDEARTLARALVSLSKTMGKNAAALITDMDQPLGVNVGNSLEVIEAIETLKGEGPNDVRALAVRCAGTMLHLASAKCSINEGMAMANESIENGTAIAKLRELISYQGGLAAVCDEPKKYLRTAPLCNVIECGQDGFVTHIDTKSVGEGVKLLGGGEVGVKVVRKIGDKVLKGDALLEIYANDKMKAENAKHCFEAFTVGDKPTENRLIFEGVE